MLGELLLESNQIDTAVESFESALEQAEKIFPGQPEVAKILSHLGEAANQARLGDKCLRYLKEAKKILDNQIDVSYPTLSVLFNIGISYYKLGESFLAFQSYKDALDSFDMTITPGKFYNALCWSMACTVFELTRLSIRAVKEKKYILSTKDTCTGIVNYLYCVSLVYRIRKEQDEELKHLEEAREIAKRVNCECGRVVLVLLLLSMTYGWMGSIEKSRSYYKEAKEMAKSLPPEDDSILPGELGMIESMKDEC